MQEAIPHGTSKIENAKEAMLLIPIRFDTSYEFSFLPPMALATPRRVRTKR